MVRRPEYQQRPAEVDAVVVRAQPPPEAVVDRAAGMLAGRVGCRFGDAHGYLSELAARQGRPVGEVAAETLAALEAEAGPGDADRLRDATRATPPGTPARQMPDGPAGAGEWSRLMSQVLDGVPGQHSALLPVRDVAGQVVDFVLAAISPSVVDLSGRRGGQIVGQRMSELYPTMVGGAVWDAWCETLVDGQPREVGPVPYIGDGARAPGDMSITVRCRVAGPGLLVAWVRHDEQGRLAERVRQTERLGNLGWGETDLVTGQVVWSAELYRIYERDPSLGPLSTDEQTELVLPEDRPVLRRAAESYARGERVDVAFRIRVASRVKHIRVVVEAVRDAGGQPVKLYGIVQDVSARELARTRLAEAQRQLVEQQRSLAAEHELAAQLQHIVLPIPAEPFDLPGLRVAIRYLPAEQAGRVGGDWYHAAVAHDGSVLLAVGDVAGHGIQAAATMAQLRHALATLIVTTTTDPAHLLSQLNRVLWSASPAATTSTAVIARYQPATRTLAWAQAGHLPPLRTRSGHTVTLRRPPGLLLGAIPDPAYGTASLTLAPDDLLVFYTDGLVERRDATLEDGLTPILTILNRISAGGSSQPLADLLDEACTANPDDDTCILAMRAVVADPGDPLTLLNRGVDRSTLPAARREVQRYAEAQGLSGAALYAFVIAVNELLTNAVRHGGGTGELEMWRHDNVVYCRVSDRGPGIPDDRHRHIAAPTADAPGGRGLWLAKQGSTDMTITTGPQGTVVILTHDIDRPRTFGRPVGTS